VRWRSDGFSVTGWLLEPLESSRAPRPLITIVHGGPSAAYRPQFVSRGMTRSFLRAGYAVFEPNPRGSFGAGEAFTQANVRDFGYGDLRDILRGIDAAAKIAPIDEHRLGITGYSYGGYMTMWTVTQTQRFAAAVAGAGVSDWLSYYGENGIDRWMIPFFGASVYDDPAIYARSAPITFIKNVKTPTFEYVGERDVECPMPQTQEFWHALATFNVPTEFVVYAGEGHGLRGPKNRADAERRTLAWFARYLRPGTSGQADR
jgi:dipeptidyl aminopeptidase/acylaminoacyl peptidase